MPVKFALFCGYVMFHMWVTVICSAILRDEQSFCSHFGACTTPARTAQPLHFLSIGWPRVVAGLKNRCISNLIDAAQLLSKQPDIQPQKNLSFFLAVDARPPSVQGHHQLHGDQHAPAYHTLNTALCEAFDQPTSHCFSNFSQAQLNFISSSALLGINKNHPQRPCRVLLSEKIWPPPLPFPLMSRPLQCPACPRGTAKAHTHLWPLLLRAHVKFQRQNHLSQRVPNSFRS